MFEMKYLIKILVLILNISYIWSKCDITIEDVDKCGMKTSFFGNRDVSVPTNEAELTQHCSDIMKNLNCVRSFVNTCLTGFVKQATELTLNNGAKHLERRCDSPKDREEFLEHVKCVSTKEKLEPFHLCSDKNLIMMEKALNMRGDDAVGAGCCTFHLFQNCVRQQNKAICGEETTEYWDEVINEIAEDSMSLSCGEYRTLDNCEKSLNPTIWTEIKAIDAIQDANTLSTMHKHKSGMALMIDFMKKLSKD